MKHKRIQCSECEGFGHIQAECANTLKSKHNFLNATKSDDDSDYSKDNESNFVIFASRYDDACATETRSSSGVPTGVLRGVPACINESGNDEDLTEEELFQGHTKWTESVKVNKKLSSQVVQLKTKKNILEKTNANLESILKQSHNKKVEFNSELENLR